MNIKKSMRKSLISDTDLYIMLIPAVIFFFIFSYIPMIGIIIAFQDYDFVSGYFNSPWVGLKNFFNFFNDPFFFRLIRNTLLLSAYSIIMGFPAPIIFALSLNEIRHTKFKRVTQTISYLPYFISVVITVGILMKLFSSDGVINLLIQSLGGEAQSFFSDQKWFRSLYIGSGIWQGVGWGSIIYLAALAGVDQELYEAAVVDGANRWRQMLHITLPSMVPTITILFILSLGNLLSVGFEKVYLMYNPGIYETADVISTYVYRRGIIGMDYSYSTAVSLFNAVITIIIIVLANKVSRKVSETSLW